MKILIQGAMDSEIEYLIENIEIKEKIDIAGYKFYKGTKDGKEIIISKTNMGVINSVIATASGITNFSPDIVINQGIAGAHRENIHIGDIVIGEKCCNINAFSMQVKEKGEGTDAFSWEAYKLEEEMPKADEALVKKVENFIKTNSNKKVYKGILGSGDVFNREYDRISWINSKFNTLSEDMESIGVYSVCNKYNVSCIGIRIISNNEMTKEKLDETKGIELQKIILNIIEKI